MKELLQVELDLNSMQAAWLRIVSNIPNRTHGGFIIELDFKSAYALPIFTLTHGSHLLSENVCPARFKVLNSKWIVTNVGSYKNDIDVMTDALIAVFGGIK